MSMKAKTKKRLKFRLIQLSMVFLLTFFVFMVIACLDYSINGSNFTLSVIKSLIAIEIAIAIAIVSLITVSVIMYYQKHISDEKDKE